MKRARITTATKERRLKRQRKERAYSKWRKTVLAERGGCEQASRQCRGSATAYGGADLHHIWRRGAGGPWMERANVAALCRFHHRWAHDNPKAAADFLLLGKPAYKQRVERGDNGD